MKTETHPTLNNVYEFGNNTNESGSCTAESPGNIYQSRSNTYQPADKIYVPDQIVHLTASPRYEMRSIENEQFRLVRFYRPKKKTQQGMTLIEIMIVIIIMAMIGTGVSMAVMQQHTIAQIQNTQTGSRVVRQAAQMYRLQKPGTCPTVTDLKNEDYLDKQARTVDAWDNPYVIECENADIFAYSLGPDGLEGTADDIGIRQTP